MIRIHDKQLAELQRALGLERFEDEMVVHLRGFAPRASETLGEAGLRRSIRSGVERAGAHGITNPGLLRFYVELMFMYGARFDADPRLPWAGAILGDAEIPDETARVQRLHDATLDNLDAVSGETRPSTILTATPERPVPTESDAVVVVPCLRSRDIKGKLFWNRTWEYTTSNTIAAIKEYLPGARVELHIQKRGAKRLSLHAAEYLTDDGEFAFSAVPSCSKAAITIRLQYRVGVVVVKGKSNAVVQPDFEIKTGKVVWHRLSLDASRITGATEVDLGDVEIKKAHFIDICDAYKSVWFGHTWIKDKTTHNLHICQINYPEPTTSTSNAGAQMNLLKSDLKDRCVILHEYGHFIGTEMLGGLGVASYDYNDDAQGQHGRDSEEHYEAAFNEGNATFMSCAMVDSPVYHDGYETNNLTYTLDVDSTLLGPHSEGSIQEALWRVYKTHKTSFKDGFWKAFTTRTKRTVRTIFDLFDNWKDLKCPSLDKLKEAMTHFNMRYGYRYTKRFTCVATPLKIDTGRMQFRTVTELYHVYGRIGGGTLAHYREELYNRNKEFNSGALRTGSTPKRPRVTAGKVYIVPKRFEIG